MGVHRSAGRGDVVAAYAFVAAQFALLAALAFWDPPPEFTVPRWLDTAARLGGVLGAAWLGIGVITLGRSLTALPLPVAHGRLKTRGLYRLSRHPIYTGLLALAWSWAVRSAAIVPLILAAALNVLLIAKARLEERVLSETYSGYDDYARRTPRFLPLGFRVRSGSAGERGTR